MSRRILVHVSPTGEVAVEAEGFRGSGCEAATRAIEEALGRPATRNRKAEYWRQSHTRDVRQQLGDAPWET